MQVINREVFRWIFMALFLGLAPVSLVIMGYGVISLDGAAGTLITLAGLTYLVGCFGSELRVPGVQRNRLLVDCHGHFRSYDGYGLRSVEHGEQSGRCGVDGPDAGARPEVWLDYCAGQLRCTRGAGRCLLAPHPARSIH